MGNILAKDKSKAHRLKAADMLPKDKAVYDLKIQRDKLKQYQKKIEVVLAREVQVAKHHLRAGDHGRALLALKKKKYQEHLLLQTDNQLLTLEQLCGQIEYALVEQDVLKGLQQGNEILKQIHKETSLDAVQKLMDDTADAIAYQAEIDEIISGTMTPEDDDEIMAQLDAMEAEELAAKLPSVPETADSQPAIIAKPATADDLPDVPSTELPDPDAADIAEPKRKVKPKQALEEPLAA
ncbi:Vacuolar protein sorting-associated protein 20 [Geranomyces variabilis]|nr:Vacuolar protein sorting-associated protein 20 [Geranomyces variabilis]